MLIAAWIVLWVWGLAELVLHVVQLARSGRTTSREWGSYVGIVVAAVLAVVLAQLVRRGVPALDFPVGRPGWVVPIAVIIALGGGFRLWSIIALGRYFRGVVHIQEGHRVVRTGPYRVLRHPSYTGLLTGMLGVSLLFGNYLAAVVFELSLIGGVLYRIRVEERVLLGALGDDYADYAGRTRRLLPGLW